MNQFSLFLAKYFKKFIPEFFLNSLIVNASKGKGDKLEITLTIGCAMMCEYCPQTLIRNISSSRNLKRKMDFEEFKEFINNVSKSTEILWTGYSEPLAHEDFDKYVLYLDNEGYKQSISTTMFGRRKTENFMTKFANFGFVTFHLPDDKNLMKLNVSKRYLTTLEEAIRFQCKYNKENVYYLVFGNDFHPEIRDLIDKLNKEKVIDPSKIEVRSHLHSRNDAVDVSLIDGKERSKNKNIISKNKKYYCSYKRLNQGVLMPDGDVNICCHDYSLDFSIGNLKNNNLKNLYKQKKLVNSGFINGQSSLCGKCEYYKPL